MRTAPLLLALAACSSTKPTTPGTPTGTVLTGVAPRTGSTVDSTPPTGPEVCDGRDNDGDGQVDEEGGPVQFADTDADGYGDPAVRTTACDPDGRWVEDDTDCDDSDASVFPGAWDSCDGRDNSCDGEIDEDHRVDWFLGTLDGGWIHEIDLTNGSTTPVVDMGGAVSPDFNSTDLLEASFGVAHQAQVGVLWSLDVCGGTMSRIGPTGVGDIGGVSFGPAGTLFGFSQGDDTIVEIDRTTGAATVLSPIGFNAGSSGMAHDCATDRLYALDNTSDQLAVIDPTSGAITSTTPISVNLTGSVGLEWDHRTHALLAAAGGTIYRIDPTTGTATTLVTVTGVSPLDDLAFFPSCP